MTWQELLVCADHNEISFFPRDCRNLNSQSRVHFNRPPKMQIARVEHLYHIAACAELGTYGGGDAMSMTFQLCGSTLPANCLGVRLKRRIIDAAVTELRHQSLIDRDSRVADLPAVVDWSNIQWSYHIKVSTRVFDEVECNLFHHGFLFQHHSLATLNSAVAYPLVGWFDSAGIISVVSDSEPAGIGLDSLKWAEQHVHCVDGDENLRFGTDMARFAVDPALSISFGHAVALDCTDPQAPRCCVTSMAIVGPDVIDSVNPVLQAQSSELFSSAVKVTLQSFVAPEHRKAFDSVFSDG
jgi:hypothetical protein